MRGKSDFLKKFNLFCSLGLISFWVDPDFLKISKPLDLACICSHLCSPGPHPAKNREPGSAVRSPRDTLTTVGV